MCAVTKLIYLFPKRSIETQVFVKTMTRRLIVIRSQPRIPKMFDGTGSTSVIS